MSRISIANARLVEAATLVAASFRNASGQYSPGLSTNLRLLEAADRELRAATIELISAPRLQLPARASADDAD